jgi:hypothetical protein
MKLTKKSVEVFDKGGEDLLCLLSKFPNLSQAKVKEEIFVGPQIKKLCLIRNSECKLSPLNWLRGNP